MVKKLTIILLCAIVLIGLSFGDAYAKSSQAKYKICRLKCIEKHEKCSDKANKKKEVIKGEIKCMTKKNECLEKCSDYI